MSSALMQFRRELDFDDIDEVVDWQLAESPAAKREKGPKPGNPWLTRVSEVTNPPPAPAKAPPDSGPPPDAVRRGYTLAEVEQMRASLYNRQDGNRRDGPGWAALAGIPGPMIGASSRVELQSPGSCTLVIAPRATPFEQTRWDTVGGVYRRLRIDTQTMRDPVRGTVDIRLKWSVDDGLNWRYQQVQVTEEMLIRLRQPMPVLRADIPGIGQIVVGIDPAARDIIRTFLERM